MHTILLVLAVICFALKAINANIVGLDLFALGWAFAVGSLLV